MKTNKLTKQKTICYIIIYLIFGALFAYGTAGLNDLNFDKMVFNPTNKFGLFMASYGMFPMYTIQLCGYTMLMVAYRKYDEALDVAESLFSIFKFFRNNKFFYTVLKVLYKILFLAFIYGAFQGSNEMWNFVLGNTIGTNLQDALINIGLPKAISIILWTLFRFATIIVVYFVLKAFSKKHKEALEFMAVVGLALYYSADIINQLKEHFHRIRFREMVAYSNGILGDDLALQKLYSSTQKNELLEKVDFHWFTQWFTIGKDDGVQWVDPRSFPSGHTTAASFSMLLVPLFAKTKELSKYLAPAFILGVGYTGAMGLSRMIRGAHYLTDVTGAALIMFTIALIFVFILNQLQKLSTKRLNKNIK